MMKRSLTMAIGALALAACTTVDPYTGQAVPNRTANGAILGALGGAALGTAAGGDDRRNALIGAGIGAIAGAAVGNYMDRQERQLRAQLGNTGVGVTRTAENEIQLNLPENVTFDFGKSNVKPQFSNTLYQVAQTLREYQSSTIDVMGHTDNIGSDAYNQTLSERRAGAVAQVLINDGVQPVRIVTTGFGESRPVATNETPEGRAQNRRVEIKIRTLQS